MSLNNYFDQWSQYWEYIEDFYLDRESLNALVKIVQSPVLVIGSGQGIIVHELRNHNFEASGIDFSWAMTQGAKARRGLYLPQADARQLPFVDNAYQTAILATGVVDFMGEEESIQTILAEAKRVTADTGQVLIAFYRLHPRAEELMRYTGLISANQWCLRKTYQSMSQTPAESFIEIQKNPNISTMGALIALIKTEMFLPRKEKAARQRWKKAWEKIKEEVENPQALIDNVPEFVPYRNETQIRQLLDRCNVPIKKLSSLYGCYIVQI